MMNRDRSTSSSLHRCHRWTILMLVMLLIPQALFLHPGRALASGGFSITATTPTSNAQHVALETVIAMTFNIDLNTATATNSTIIINGSMSGVVPATFSYDGGTRTLTPARIFKAGEVVSVNATSGVKSSSAASLTPFEFQFTPGLQNNRCVDGFSSSGASGPVAKIYHNTGSGFADSGVVLPGLYSAAAWGDYDNDGSLDLVLSGQDSSNSTVLTRLYHNDGNGAFNTVSAGFANVYSAALAWGDYNGDNRLELAIFGYKNNTEYVGSLYRTNDCADLGIKSWRRVCTSAGAATRSERADRQLSPSPWMWLTPTQQ